MDDNVSGTWQQNDQGPPPGYLTCPDASTCFDMSGSYASDSASAATSESVYSSNDFGSTWTVYPLSLIHIYLHHRVGTVLVPPRVDHFGLVRQ